MLRAHPEQVDDAKGSPNAVPIGRCVHLELVDSVLLVFPQRKELTRSACDCFSV